MLFLEQIHLIIILGVPKMTSLCAAWVSCVITVEMNRVHGSVYMAAK